MITAGPASGTASWSTKKMPVPTVAPTPNIVSWKVPKLRSSSGPACGPVWRRDRLAPPQLVAEAAMRIRGLSHGAASRRRGQSLRPTPAHLAGRIGRDA